jgi:hypothetical protein
MSPFLAAPYSPNIPHRQISQAERQSIKPSCGAGHSALQVKPISMGESLSTNEMFLERVFRCHRI